MKITTTLLSLALAAALVPASLAQRPERRAPGDMLERAMQQLELTETQRDTIEPVLAEHRSTLELLRPQIAESRRALQQQIGAATFDESAIRAAAAELALLEADRAVARAELMSRVRAELTAEQLEKLEEMQSRRAERRENRRGGFHGHLGKFRQMHGHGG